MSRHIDVHDAPSFVGDDDEDVERAEVSVGTVKKSAAQISWAWRLRKERQLGDGGRRSALASVAADG